MLSRGALRRLDVLRSEIAFVGFNNNWVDIPVYLLYSRVKFDELDYVLSHLMNHGDVTIS